MSQTAPLIYVVEDDRAIREILEKVISDAGYEMLSCATLDEVHFFIHAERPDVVIFDNSCVEHAAGWALLSQVRAHPATATLPIILLTMGAPYLREWSDALHDQGCYLVEKPFELNKLLDTIATALGVQLTERMVSGA
jgi:DNA-binding NtrC family response regulator